MTPPTSIDQARMYERVSICASPSHSLHRTGPQSVRRWSSSRVVGISLCGLRPAQASRAQGIAPRRHGCHAFASLRGHSRERSTDMPHSDQQASGLSSTGDTRLAAARERQQRRAWHEAYELFVLADRESPLSGDDLEDLAQSAYLSGM